LIVPWWLYYILVITICFCFFLSAGEWTAEFLVQGASMQDYQRYAQAQLNVYSRATFGWAYWAYKCQYNHWSLKWMIENGYIKL